MPPPHGRFTTLLLIARRLLGLPFASLLFSSALARESLPREYVVGHFAWPLTSIDETNPRRLRAVCRDLIFRAHTIPIQLRPLWRHRISTLPEGRQLMMGPLDHTDVMGRMLGEIRAASTLYAPSGVSGGSRGGSETKNGAIFVAPFLQTLPELSRVSVERDTRFELATFSLGISDDDFFVDEIESTRQLNRLVVSQHVAC